MHLYRSGTPILDILWALRLKNVETLQHYLQEISTQITMVDLPPAAKSNVIIFAEMYPFFLSTSKRRAGEVLARSYSMTAAGLLSRVDG